MYKVLPRECSRLNCEDIILSLTVLRVVSEMITRLCVYI